MPGDVCAGSFKLRRVCALRYVDRTPETSISKVRAPPRQSLGLWHLSPSALTSSAETLLTQPPLTSGLLLNAVA